VSHQLTVQQLTIEELYSSESIVDHGSQVPSSTSPSEESEESDDFELRILTCSCSAAAAPIGLSVLVDRSTYLLPI
jgi:hypothetical protein